jgi:hypothetical protein
MTFQVIAQVATILIATLVLRRRIGIGARALKPVIARSRRPRG